MTEHLFAPPRSTPEPEPAPPRQRTLEDLGTPLHEVTFVVFDIETTGGKATDGGITEIGAVKRFAHPRQLVSWIGMDIREYASGGKSQLSLANYYFFADNSRLISMALTYCDTD